MGIYVYEVVNNNGNIISGKIESETKSNAIEQLQRNGYMVINIKEVSNPKKFQIISFKPKVKIDEISLFSRQLAVMLNVGIPITRALVTLRNQIKNSTFRNALDDIISNVEGGMSLTRAFSNHPYIFNDLYLGMIGAGEVGGNLEEVLLRISEQMQKEKTLRDNVKSATRYPIAVLCFAIFILIIMLIFLVPIFENFFSENAEIPAITKWVINLSESMRFYWYIWLIIMLALTVGIIYYIKTTKGRQIWDKIRFKLPGFGPLLHKSVIARFSRVLATLMINGIPIIQALEAAGLASGSSLIEELVKKAILQIQEGNNITDPLEESGFFPPMMIQMFRIGEETGALPDLLNQIAGFYEDEVATLAKGLTSLIEPLLLIIVGILVGGILIALYLPIFTAITHTGIGG